MNKQSILIFKLPELFKILNELKDHLDFNIFSFDEKKFVVAIEETKKLAWDCNAICFCRRNIVMLYFCGVFFAAKHRHST